MWVARDKDGSLFIYSDQPAKPSRFDDGKWHAMSGDYIYIPTTLGPDPIPDLTYEDGAIEIEELVIKRKGQN